MNTLGKSITERFFQEPSTGYASLQAHWSALVAARTPLSAADHLLYQALRGKDWRKGFSPITNGTKIANGATSGDGPGFTRALRQIRRGYVGPFTDLLSISALPQLVELLPQVGYGENPLPEVAYRTQP
ncbi:hypothetical protein [Armatimonas sp.]|uniref:hypothetical protein n=1 Tax=Armatimonas sp. TaxID=1872638 RepID=UPI00286D0060|nr:hypothetical protein [Armatimonas sp.]